MRIILAIALFLGLAACQTTLGGSQDETRSSVAFAMETSEGILVETVAGNRHTFTRTQVCHGQTWMQVGPERFSLRQTGTTVLIDGRTPIEGLRCPIRNDRPRNSAPRETPTETRERSGEIRPGETRGQEGRTDTGENTDIRSISG